MIRGLSWLVAGALALAAGGAAAQAQVEIKLARFFGVCDTKTADVAKAVGEACIVEAIIESFNQQNPDVRVVQLPADWNSYYDQIKTAMVGGNPPDVLVMHKHRIPEFASIGALAEITKADYDKAKIDFADFTERAVEGVSLRGKQYGVPFDFHAYLWHVNLDIMAAAGLVDGQGKPVLPRSPEELLAHAKQVKERTGKNYLLSFFDGVAPSMRLYAALMAQQGVNPYGDKGVSIDSPASRNAVRAFTQLAEAGTLDLKVPTDAVRGAWFKGDAAILIDGTWRVDANDAAIGKEGVTLKRYYVASHPQLFARGGAWADTHFWTIPASVKAKDPKKFEAAMRLLAHINKHNIDWARTGHLPVRQSVLASPELQKLPHRGEYAETAAISYYLPPARKYGAIQDAIGRGLVDHFQNGKPLDTVLKDMQAKVEDALQ
jgi:multiple sugar transport system substrate-binding protein